MILQSTQSVQELLPRPQVAPTSTSTSTQASAETPFRDLLDGALQNRTEPPKAKDAAAQPKETVKSSDKEQPVQDAATGKEPKPAGKARTPASEEDDAQEVAIAAAAAILAPLAVPVQEPVQAQTSATAAQQTIQPVNMKLQYIKYQCDNGTKKNKAIWNDSMLQINEGCYQQDRC